MHQFDLLDLLPGEVGWVCACGDAHPLVKGAWNAATDACAKRLPAFRRLPEPFGDRLSLTVAPVAA